MKKARRTGVLFFFLVAIVISSSPMVTRAVGAQTAPSVNVTTSPQSPTPYDNVTIRANVTASSPILNVTLYYRIGPPTLTRHFNSTLDYNHTRMMISYQLNNENGVWDYVFDKQSDGRVIYFYVEAVDSQGLTGTWADGWPEYRLPHIISVANPGQAQLDGLSVNLNYLLLSEQQQFANITLSLVGYFPNFPEQDQFSVTLHSPRYVQLFEITEAGGGRFDYLGRFSGLVDLEGNFQNAPYDTYTLFLNLTIPYRIQNLTYVNRYPIPIYAAGPEIYQSWNVPWPQLNNKTTANSTSLYFSTILSRRVSPFYPPLVLMVTAFAVLGLLPIIAKYFSDKRFDLFLNVIILASSAELSQAIYPVGGLLSTNLFVEIFPVLLLCAIVLMAISSPSKKWRTTWRRNKQESRLKTIAVDEWESIVTLVVMSSASAYIFSITYNMPALPRILTIVGGLFGSCVVIYLSAYHKMTSRRWALIAIVFGLTMIAVGFITQGSGGLSANALRFWFGMVIETSGVLVVIPAFLAFQRTLGRRLSVRRP